MLDIIKKKEFLIELLQMLMRKYGIYKIIIKTQNKDTGFIYIKDGTPHSAIWMNKKGEEALEFLFKYPEDVTYEVMKISSLDGVERNLYVKDIDALISQIINKIESKQEVNMTKYDELLSKLHDIPGYIASAIYTPRGEIVASHSAKEDMEDVFIKTSSILNQVTNASDKAGLKGTDLVQTEIDIGTLIIQRGKNAIVSVILDKTGNVGMAKLALQEIADSI